MLKGILLIISFGVLVWSGIGPKDRLTWILEVAPVIAGLPIAIYLHRKYRLTTLLLILMTIHGVILCVGGKYTYAEVPIGFYVQEFLGGARNHYDRLGHIAQGFVPAIMARELLIRRKVVHSKIALFWFTTCICLAFSAFYELIEWSAALMSKEASESFLGTQGDNWDTQWDMFLCLIGALTSQLFLWSLHQKQINQLEK